MSSRRFPKDERRVIHAAVAMLRDVQPVMPSNPADLKRLVEMAQKSYRVQKKVIAALQGVLAGPHCDFDYVKEALDELKE